jgi:hypothetical protein
VAVDERTQQDRGGDEGAPPAVAEDRGNDRGREEGSEEREPEGVADVVRRDLADVLRPQEEDGIEPEEDGVDADERTGSGGGRGRCSNRRARVGDFRLRDGGAGIGGAGGVGRVGRVAQRGVLGRRGLLLMGGTARRRARS